jgi:hypothetical protein
MRGWIVGAAVLAVGSLGMAQETVMTRNDSDFHSSAWLHEQGDKLLAEARAGSGSATLQLEKYPGHYTSLTARTKSGGGEMHGMWSDVFVALDGEANVITGGSLVGRKDGPGGESRGTSVEGGTDHVMHKGDVIHISPGVAHQTMVPAGKTFVYFVVKAEAQKSGVMPVTR